MEHKVLIADDSLTIQKVIKITLANEPFELHECDEAKDLVSKVKELQPAMVLLDFNLSDNKTGYDLCREIKEINPEIGVLMLFGTFDTIDDQLLHDCGCNYHIVKPFDGNKFINLCRSLANDFESGESSSTPAPAKESNEPTLPEAIDEESEDDNWVVNQPNVIEEDEELPEQIQSKQNELQKEVEEWGMEVPSVIDGSDEDSVEMPEIIAEEKSSPSFDSAQDLNEEGFELESNSGAAISHEHEGTETDEEVKNLEQQIADEVDSDDLWAADEIIEETESSTEELDDEDEEEEGFKAFDADSIESVDMEELDSREDEFEEHVAAAGSGPSDFPEDVMSAGQTSSTIDMSEIEERLKDQIELEIRDQLAPIVEKYVKEFCKEQVEKIAWEVIPDLAENIIKKEIQKISDSIMD